MPLPGSSACRWGRRTERGRVRRPGGDRVCRAQRAGPGHVRPRRGRRRDRPGGRDDRGGACRPPRRTGPGRTGHRRLRDRCGSGLLGRAGLGTWLISGLVHDRRTATAGAVYHAITRMDGAKMFVLGAMALAISRPARRSSILPRWLASLGALLAAALGDVRPGLPASHPRPCLSGVRVRPDTSSKHTLITWPQWRLAVDMSCCDLARRSAYGLPFGPIAA
jgi:hypothetical protein